MKGGDCFKVDGFECRVLPASGPARVGAEGEVRAAGFPLPLAHRSEWAAMRPQARSLFFAVRSARGSACGGFAAEMTRSRVLPGRLHVRVERFGASIAPEAIGPSLRALARAARQDHRVLRLSVEAFSLDENVREAIAGTLDSLGFIGVVDTRRYPRTVVVDLSGTEEAVLGRFHGTARRHIRAVGKHPVQIRPVDSAVLSTRMAELMDETMSRTAGSRRSYDWPARIAFTKANPNLARLLGLFRTDIEGPSALLAYAWGCMNGDYAHYDAAASTRATDLKLPLNYGIAWELMRWARHNGCTWFDFGGVTAGSHGDDKDRLGGISDFKRYFSAREAEVGGEWMLEPRQAQVRVANALRAAAGWLGQVTARRIPLNAGAAHG
jgi:hypothetical protein